MYVIYERRLVSGFFSVTEAQITAALRLVLERCKMVIEPSAAVPLAVALYDPEVSNIRRSSLPPLFLLFQLEGAPRLAL